MNKNTIVFLSDFGLSDPYAGIVKGVILSINQTARIIDLTHAVPHQNIRQAAFILYFSFVEFPPGTIFLSVVDPGVGSKRAGLIVKSRNRFLVGPDNGLFGPIIQQDPDASCLKIISEKITAKARKTGWKAKTSRTFHARDIFAPAAALLSLGTRPEDIGTPHPQPVALSFPEPEVKNATIKGQVIYFDHFGNAVTNIPSRLLAELNGPAPAVLAIENRKIKVPFRSTYSLAQENEPFFLINSFDLVEIAVNCGDARKALELKTGDKLVIRCESNRKGA